MRGVQCVIIDDQAIAGTIGPDLVINTEEDDLGTFSHSGELESSLLDATSPFDRRGP